MSLILVSAILLMGSFQADVAETPAPHFDDWLAELESSECPAAETWSMFQGPYAGQPEFLGNRELPMKAIYAAYQFNSSDDASQFLASFESNFTAILINDRYLGTVTRDTNFGFPQYPDASIALHYVSQPDMESVQSIELHVFALVIQRSSTISLSIVYNSYSEGMSDYLWATTESFAQRWDGNENGLGEAIPEQSDFPRPADNSDALMEPMGISAPDAHTCRALTTPQSIPTRAA